MSRTEHPYPGHFIASARCQFRRHTSVNGRYRISTVGDYRPDTRRFPEDAEMELIGLGRTFETMVFVLGQDGQPVSWGEHFAEGYNEADDAQRGHERAVEEFEAKSAEQHQRDLLAAAERRRANDGDDA